MDEGTAHDGQVTLRSSVGAFSAGTPVRIIAEDGDWVDVQTVARMPHIKGYDMLDDRPIITGLRRSWLVFRRARAQVANKTD